MSIRDGDNVRRSGQGMLGRLGSLKLTVALFALSLVTVLVGTLAQDEMNMLEVKQRYFLSWIAPLHFDDFFPQAFFPHDKPIPGVIPFPGGALIGLLLMINLVAAKATRFKIHAQWRQAGGGTRLDRRRDSGWQRSIFVAGHSSDGLQGTPPMSYQQLWAAVLAGLTVLGHRSRRRRERALPTQPSSRSRSRSQRIIGIFIAYALFTGFRIGDPGLRIVWQLTKGLGAGVILMFGCRLSLTGRAAMCLLHAGRWAVDGRPVRVWRPAARAAAESGRRAIVQHAGQS